MQIQGAHMEDHRFKKSATTASGARRHDTFALSYLSWIADGDIVKFRLRVVDVVRTAIGPHVVDDSSRMDGMLDGVRLTFQSAPRPTILVRVHCPELVHPYDSCRSHRGLSSGRLLTVRCPTAPKSKQCSGRCPRPVVHFTTQGMTILKEPWFNQRDQS